jgi:Ca2+-transporting ATPase
VIATGSLGAYLYGRRRYGASPAAGTMAFSSLIIAQLLHALSCRTPGSSMLSRRRQPPNHYLNGAVAGSLAAQAALTLIPPLGRALGVAPLDARGWVVTAAAGVLPLLAIETAKALPTPGLRVTPDSATQEPQVRQ